MLSLSSEVWDSLESFFGDGSEVPELIRKLKKSVGTDEEQDTSRANQICMYGSEPL
ncbi:MAG: hypothetical protein ABI954_12635 [Pyrinomonadaceae bacterium]